MKERKREEKNIKLRSQISISQEKKNIVCLIDISREIKREEQETHPIQFPL